MLFSMAQLQQGSGAEAQFAQIVQTLKPEFPCRIQFEEETFLPMAQLQQGSGAEAHRNVERPC